MLRYRSPLFKILYTIFFMPGLLAGSFEEKQSLTIPLFENYVEECVSMLTLPVILLGIICYLF